MNLKFNTLKSVASNKSYKTHDSLVIIIVLIKNDRTSY